jgi:diacylglycerol kinase (ATP)
MRNKGARRFYLIVNPVAGLRRGSRAVRHLVSLLRKEGVEVDFHITRHSGHAIELAAEAVQKGFDLVVAVGGDGTVIEVAQGLIGSRIPMGIVPWGSGNGLAFDLGIPAGLRKCTKVLVHGTDNQLDFCRFNDQHFVCTAGIGFNAQIAAKMNQSSVRGFLKYVQLVIQESIRFKPFRIRMKLNGDHVDMPVFMVTFANASQFGNHAHIAPFADMSDGLLDIVVVKPFNKILLPLVAFSLFSKRIERFPFVESFRAEVIHLEAEDVTHYYYDGESGVFKNPSVISIESRKIIIRS